MPNLSLASPNPTIVPHIYQYVCNLRGVLQFLPEAAQVEADLPSIGPVTDKYLNAHGYNSASIKRIHYTYEKARSASDFVSELTAAGMAEKEVNWLWDLIIADAMHK